MSEFIEVLVVIYIVVAGVSAPFVVLSEKHYGDDNWFRYCIFWPAYVVRWLIINAWRAVQGK
jgi:hypothetical protein